MAIRHLYLEFFQKYLVIQPPKASAGSLENNLKSLAVLLYLLSCQLVYHSWYIDMLWEMLRWQHKCLLAFICNTITIMIRMSYSYIFNTIIWYDNRWCVRNNVSEDFSATIFPKHDKLSYAPDLLHNTKHNKTGFFLDVSIKTQG